MINSRGEKEPSPVGHVVTDFFVLGEEMDGERRIVGADVLVDIQPVGRFFLRIVTKYQFANDTIEETFSNESFEDLFDNLPTDDKRPPYVLNDIELSDEVLTRKIKGRVVEQDFATSLWYRGPCK